MPYPAVTERNLSLGFQEVLYYVNDVSDSWFGNMILISAYLVILFGVYTKGKDFPEAMAISGFVTLILSVLFWTGGMINITPVMFSLVMAVLGFVALMFGKRA